MLWLDSCEVAAFPQPLSLYPKVSALKKIFFVCLSLQERLSFWLNFQRSTLTSLPRFALYPECFTPMVKWNTSASNIILVTYSILAFFLFLFQNTYVDCCFCRVPSVYADGSICLDILQNRWSPTYDVSSILTSIQVGAVFHLTHTRRRHAH